jgi:hypothetical protein
MMKKILKSLFILLVCLIILYIFLLRAPLSKIFLYAQNSLDDYRDIEINNMRFTRGDRWLLSTIKKEGDNLELAYGYISKPVFGENNGINQLRAYAFFEDSINYTELNISFYNSEKNKELKEIINERNINQTGRLPECFNGIEGVYYFANNKYYYYLPEYGLFIWSNEDVVCEFLH